MKDSDRDRELKKMVDWTALPRDALEYISNRLANDVDYVRFRSVCTSWRLAAPKRPYLPWLLLDRSRSHSFAGLCNFPNPELLVPELPDQIRGMRFQCSASPGWLAWSDYNNDKCAPDNIILHNPFTGVLIPLPVSMDARDDTLIHMSTKRLYRNIHQIALSSDPLNKDCVILARCYNGWLIRCCPGDSLWTLMWPPDKELRFIDITFYMGRFYAVSEYNYIVCACDIGPEARLMEIEPVEPLFPNGVRENWYHHAYLVVSSGVLLLVAISSTWKRRYKVFQIDLDGGKLRFLKLENLADRALFFGRCGESISLSVSNSSWCKRNYIYEIDNTFNHKKPGGHKTSGGAMMCDRIRAFSMEDGSITIITVFSDNYWGSKWIRPSLCY